jgi:hypothetical protein
MKGKESVIIIIQFHKFTKKISRKLDTFQRVFNDFYGVDVDFYYTVDVYIL